MPPSFNLRRIVLALLAAMTVGLASPLPVSAQAPSQPAATQIQPDAPPPPYEPQLLRLSEIIGAMHYLRALCGHDDETTLWRDEMEALLEAEAPEEIRRRRMVDGFNRGYESFRSVYRTCTPAATASSDRYLAEGAKLAADITARYGK